MPRSEGVSVGLVVSGRCGKFAGASAGGTRPASPSRHACPPRNFTPCKGYVLPLSSRELMVNSGPSSRSRFLADFSSAPHTNPTSRRTPTVTAVLSRRIGRGREASAPLPAPHRGGRVVKVRRNLVDRATMSARGPPRLSRLATAQSTGRLNTDEYDSKCLALRRLPATILLRTPSSGI